MPSTQLSRWAADRMADESPPWAAPRPLTGFLGCLTAACAPACRVTIRSALLSGVSC
jgi:hypothetical protein